MICAVASTSCICNYCFYWIASQSWFEMSLKHRWKDWRIYQRKWLQSRLFRYFEKLQIKEPSIIHYDTFFLDRTHRCCQTSNLRGPGRMWFGPNWWRRIAWIQTTVFRKWSSSRRANCVYSRWRRSANPYPNSWSSRYLLFPSAFNCLCFNFLFPAEFDSTVESGVSDLQRIQIDDLDDQESSVDSTLAHSLELTDSVAGSDDLNNVVSDRSTDTVTEVIEPKEYSPEYREGEERNIVQLIQASFQSF